MDPLGLQSTDGSGSGILSGAAGWAIAAGGALYATFGGAIDQAATDVWHDIFGGGGHSASKPAQGLASGLISRLPAFETYVDNNFFLGNGAAAGNAWGEIDSGHGSYPKAIGLTTLLGIQVGATAYAAAEGGGALIGESAYTTLYRAVGGEEAADLLASGVLREGGGSMSGKWFAESAEDAAEWGRTFFKIDGKPFDVVAFRFRNSAANSMFRMGMLDNIGPARYLDLSGFNPSALRQITFLQTIFTGL